MRNRHLFVIPTDRPCADALRSYGPEVKKLANVHGHDVIVVVLEDRTLDQRSSLDHESAVRDVVGSDPHVSGFVVRQSDWAGMIADQTWPKFMHDMIEDEGVSYGRAFNKTAILADALHASVIHRRDSDTSLPDICIDWDLLPSDIESEQLDTSSVDVVGGNYWGNWNVALGPLAEEPERLRLILAAHGIPVVGQQSIINEQLPRAAEPPKADRGSVTHGAYPDLGNCALLTQAALALPAPLITNTIGTDYIFLASAVHFGRAWLHGVSVRHTHSPDRSEPGYLHDYWLRRVRQMDFLLVLHHVQNEYREADSYDAEREGLSVALGDLEGSLVEIDPARRVYWAAYAEAFRGSVLDRQTQIADHIRDVEGQTKELNDAEMYKYGELLRNWSILRPELTKRVETFLTNSYGLTGRSFDVESRQRRL